MIQAASLSGTIWGVSLIVLAFWMLIGGIGLIPFHYYKKYIKNKKVKNDKH